MADAGLPSIFGDLRAPATVTASEITLRGYQRDAIEAIGGHRQTGCRILCVAPTGAGKTTIFCKLVADEIARGGRALVVAHREELISQAFGRLVVSGIPDRLVGVIMADGVIVHPVTRRPTRCVRPLAPVQVASIDTLRRRTKPVGITLVIVDECHRALAKSYRDLFDAYPDAHHLGFTATPYRGDGRGLGDVYRVLVQVTTPKSLMADGYLAEPRVFSHPHRANLDNIKTTAGDYDQEQLAKAVDKADLIGSIVDHWAKHLAGVRTVAFATNVEHSKHIVEMFRGVGVAAEHLDGETPDDDRSAILRRVDSGETMVVSNVGVLCLDAETEILTSAGWTGIDDMTLEHEVANWDNDDVTFERPSEVVRRQRLPGERMVRAKGMRVDARVTEGHGMLYRTTINGTWLKVPARDIVDRAVELPVAGVAAPFDIRVEAPAVNAKHREKMLQKTRYNLRKLEGVPAERVEAETRRRVDRKLSLRHKAPHELTVDECALIGFWIGDGSRTALKSGGCEFVLCQSFAYPKIIEWVDGVLARVGVDFIRRVVEPPKCGAHTNNQSVRWSLPRGTGGGSQQRNGLYPLEKYLDKNGSPLLWGLNEAQFDALIEGFWFADGEHADGTRRPRRGLRIGNTNLRLLDTLQAIGSARGYATTLTLGCNHLKIYKLRLTKRSTLHMSHDRFQVEDGWRDERVWCVRTRTKNIITRRGGRVLVMGNCEGWDQPSVKGCILARPTKSRALYVQCAGRVLRPWNDLTPIILDHAGCVLEHDLPHADWELSLEGKKKAKNKISVKECPACFGAVPSNAPICPFCGTPFGAADATLGRELSEADGVLVEVHENELRALKRLNESTRAELARWANAVDRKYSLPPGTTNRACMKEFRVSRQKMSPAQLEEVRAWFLRNDPWLLPPPAPPSVGAVRVFYAPITVSTEAPAW